MAKRHAELAGNCSMLYGKITRRDDPLENR